LFDKTGAISGISAMAIKSAHLEWWKGL